MCGIIGIIAKTPVAAELIEGLRRLEYRGYDSAGVATLINGRIERRRAEGKLANLVARLKREPVHGTIAIGHNGIIENFQALRRELAGLGYKFYTETDTEAVAILATHHLAQGLAPAQAVA